MQLAGRAYIFYRCRLGLLAFPFRLFLQVNIPNGFSPENLNICVNDGDAIPKIALDKLQYTTFCLLSKYTVLP